MNGRAARGATARRHHLVAIERRVLKRRDALARAAGETRSVFTAHRTIEAWRAPGELRSGIRFARFC